jgi:hypothetical protein
MVSVNAKAHCVATAKAPVAVTASVSVMQGITELSVRVMFQAPG